MKNIQIDKIKIAGNIRKDYGDLTELTASIREHGVRKPIELTTSNSLVDGYRRLKAAKAAGLTEIPFFYWDGKIDKATSQMLAGIFQKNLNSVEEGKAFRDYMDATKINVKDLAKKISKQITYVNKRLLLVDLSKEVQDSLINKKILMGHALLLAKFTKQDSSKFLREIIREKHSVEMARENTQYRGFSVRLVDAKFDKSQCKDCKYNGSVQSELFETGTILNGTCMNAGCYHKKVKEFVKQKKAEFKDVLYKSESEYDTPKGYQDIEYSYSLEEKGITKSYMNKCKKEMQNYLVRIKEDGTIQEFFKIPTKKEKAKGSEKEKEKLSMDTLSSRIHEFKRSFFINKSIELMQPGTKQTKALNVFRLLKSSSYSDIGYKTLEEINKIVKIIGRGYGQEIFVKNIFEATEDQLDNVIKIISSKALRSTNMKELIEISGKFKVNLKKHFVITKEYLVLYTKDQLYKLIKEFKLEQPDKDLKKGELIEHILKQKLKDKIPKVMR